MQKNEKQTNSQKMINMCYDAVERLGGGSDILSILGSWGDTLDDEECLVMMQEWLENNISIYGRCDNCGDEGDIRHFIRAVWKEEEAKKKMREASEKGNYAE